MKNMSVGIKENERERTASCSHKRFELITYNIYIKSNLEILRVPACFDLRHGSYSCDNHCRFFCMWEDYPVQSTAWYARPSAEKCGSDLSSFCRRVPYCMVTFRICFADQLLIIYIVDHLWGLLIVWRFVLCLLDSLGRSLQFRGMPVSLWCFMNLTVVCSKKSTTMVAAACVALPAVN